MNIFIMSFFDYLYGDEYFETMEDCKEKEFFEIFLREMEDHNCMNNYSDDDEYVDGSYKDCEFIVNLIHSYGINFYCKDTNKAFDYDGPNQSINIDNKDLFSILHEFGHWMNASEENKLIDNFNMDDGSGDSYLRIGEDLLATLIPVLIFYILNLKCKRNYNLVHIMGCMGSDDILKETLRTILIRKNSKVNKYIIEIIRSANKLFSC